MKKTVILNKEKQSIISITFYYKKKQYNMYTHYSTPLLPSQSPSKGKSTQTVLRPRAAKK